MNNLIDEIQTTGMDQEIMERGVIENTAADPWKPFTLEDAYKERPPIEYIAAGLFALPSLNIVYGPPGCMKSFLLADLAICVASGKTWLPPAPWQPGSSGIETMTTQVMWIDFDMGTNRTHERFGALAKARNLPIDTPLYYYSMPLPWLDGSKKESVGALSLRAIELGARLIIIDNLGTVSGGIDENSGSMINVMNQFRQLAEETRAAVVLIHHQRKSSGVNTRAGDSLRGHSSIEASLDLALQVEREYGSDTITIKSTKTRGVDVIPFSAQLTYDHKDNGDLDTARFFGAGVEDKFSNHAIEREIMAAIEGRALNQSELVKTAKENLEVGDRRILDTIKRMAANKKITERTGAHNMRIYSKLVDPVLQFSP